MLRFSFGNERKLENAGRNVEWLDRIARDLRVAEPFNSAITDLWRAKRERERERERDSMLWGGTRRLEIKCSRILRSDNTSQSYKCPIIGGTDSSLFGFAYNRPLREILPRRPPFPGLSAAPAASSAYLRQPSFALRSRPVTNPRCFLTFPRCVCRLIPPRYILLPRNDCHRKEQRIASKKRKLEEKM
jgi:hypothetical protein